MTQDLSLRAASRFAALAFLGSLVLAASAQVALPLWPVPATMQSLAVLLLGALGGGRLAASAVALYLIEGAMGLPVFASGMGGPAVLAGPTAGYLLGFLPAAWLAGYAARGTWWRQGAALLAAHLVLFVPGVLWLAAYVGMEKALWAGFVLFIPGTALKTALALASLKALRR
ncbi:biotin transporter BioY [Sabulicella glaciei]|uniref:Biotin transporter n=1 Tax=Sabulicella glaciei TaxID=2984948 RepID=A0ABT3NRZ4_9PROT|nr:biotin transporter BioY [Roseococcus sp. MDT2-1-1]MCW8084934.1 biotin transporter BioY [Roseococcus sp. MDT2-1-1]